MSKTGLFFPIFVFRQLLQMSQTTANSSAASKMGADGGFASSLCHHIISPGFSQLLKLIFEQLGSPLGHFSLDAPLAACFFMGLEGHVKNPEGGWTIWLQESPGKLANPPASMLAET